MKTLTGRKKAVFRKSLNLSRGGIYKRAFNELFKGKNRIEIPVEHLDFKSTDGYKLVTKFLKKNGYTVTDYVGGYCYKNGDQKNILKIGRIIKDNKYLTDKFRDCPTRQKVKLVLSRHPYDVACASFGQEWDSCLNIDNGEFKDELIETILAGLSMIAYLVRDSKGFSKPLGRVFVIPYIDEDSGLHWLHTANTPIGLFDKKHNLFLREWLDKNYNEKFVKPKFELKPKYVFGFPTRLMYDNGDDDAVRIPNTNVLSNRKYIRNILNNSKNIFEEINKLGISTTEELSEKGDIDLFREEVRAFVDYHNLYLRDDAKFRVIKLFDVWLNEKEPPEHLGCKYLTVLNANKMKTVRSTPTEKWIERFYKEEEGDSMYYIKMYANILKEKVDWEKGKKIINEYLEDGYMSVEGKPFERLANVIEMDK